jgi:ABC-2 type transport system permease protein
MVAGLFLVLTFVFSESLRIRLDLTSDKRYTMTRAAREVAKTIQKPVTVELFLAGELQPGFRKLQQEITGKIRDLDRYSNSPVRVIVKDPYEETSASNRNQYFEELAGKGVLPTDVRQRTEQGTITRLIFPGAIIHMDGKAEAVNFLKHNPGFSAEVNLNHSVESIEFELVSALKRLSATHKPNLAFLQGHDELNPYEVRDLAETASTIFNVSFIVTEELESIERPDILVIADPELPFSEKDKFIIDQAFMSGSRLIWLIDPVQVSLDSLSMGMTTLAFPRDLNINDLLFNYGARVNTDLLQDVVCQQILVNTAPSTNRPEFTPQPWYYSPLLTPSDHHPVSRHLNLLQSEFVSSLDTVAGAGNIIKTIILSTSPYARMVRTPAEVSLSIIDSPPARELFNIPHIPVGVLFEGTFFSAFRNRMLNNLGIQNMKIRNETSFGKMMVFADGSLIANKVRYQQGKEPEKLPLGYDRVSQQTFGNKEYFLNVLQYLSDDIGIMELRNRNLQLRLLDKVMLRESRNLWVLINTILPILMVLIFGGVYYTIRRRQWKVNKS